MMTLRLLRRNESPLKLAGGKLSISTIATLTGLRSPSPMERLIFMGEKGNKSEQYGTKGLHEHFYYESG